MVELEKDMKSKEEKSVEKVSKSVEDKTNAEEKNSKNNKVVKSETPKKEHKQSAPEDRFYVNDKLPKDVDQNITLSSTIKINSETEELKEVITKNPSVGTYKELRQRLSTTQESDLNKKKLGGASNMSYSNHTPEEEPLLHKRDWYRVWGNEGKYFPEDTDLSILMSPQKAVNLALDQVKTLVLAGFRVQNNRTGDVVNKRRLDKYIANWSKDKNPIL